MIEEPPLSVFEARQRRLRYLQAIFEAGNEAALYEAACVCADDRRRLGRGRDELQDDQVVMPQWIAHALISRQADRMSQLSSGKGRHARWLVGFRQDQVDFARYDCVVEGLERRIAVWTDDEIFAAAAEVLKGPWKGTPRQIEESYYRVKARLKTEPWRYCQFHYYQVKR